MSNHSYPKYRVQVREPILEDREGIHLALGGGAAKGFAHVGVLKAIQEAKIPIASICGTSMGALVGGCYAIYQDSDTVFRTFYDYIHSEDFNRARYNYIRVTDENRRNGRFSLRSAFRHSMLVGRSMAMGSVFPWEEFEIQVHSVIPNKTYSNLQIPFFALSADLITRKEIVFNEGLLRSAIMASCAIPGVFPPIHSGNAIYVDGGWANKIPVIPLLAMGAPHVLALDVGDISKPDVNPRRGLSIINEGNAVAQKRLEELQCAHASLMWRPPVHKIHWANFGDIENGTEVGYQFAKENMHQLHAILEQKPLKKLRWWQRLAARVANLPEDGCIDIPAGFEFRGIWEVDEYKVD